MNIADAYDSSKKNIEIFAEEADDKLNYHKLNHYGLPSIAILLIINILVFFFFSTFNLKQLQ